MKATICELWQTGREIITFDNDEFSRPQKFSDLKKCENVIVGEKIDDDPRCKTREVMIDNKIYYVTPNYASHPAGGLINFLEIM